jgi:CDP-alcohol phosphatidyltransferase-like enzyme
MTSGVSEAEAVTPPVPGTSVPTAVLLATAPADGAGPAALLSWGGSTLLARTIEQLASLGAGAFHVVTRPQWEHDVARAATRAAVTASADAAEDLRIVAGIARGGDGALIVADAAIVTQRGVLAHLVLDPRVGTGILAARRWAGRRLAPRIRRRRSRVVSASSPYHAVRRPNGVFLGVLKVDPSSRDEVAAIADRLAGLRASPPPDWEALFEARWERRLAEAEDARDIVLQQAAAREDVASLLVTGLVRDGMDVGCRHLNRLFWARPLSREGAAAAETEIGAVDEDRLLLDQAVKSNDGFFTTFLVSPYSRFIARWAARRGLTPNQVTTVSLLVGLVAAAAFATGDRWGLVAGAVLLQVSFTLDCVDGQLARYTLTFSSLGAWLDSIFDRTKEYAVYAGLAIGAASAGDAVWLLAGCALALQTVRHMVYVAYSDARPRFELPPQPPIEQPDDRIGAAAVLDEEDDEAEDAEHEPHPTSGRSLSRRAMGAWRAVERHAFGHWPRKIAAFPIGERFAAISLTAALFEPRTTFVVLLVCGGFAAVYTFTGRVLRSVA